MTDDERLNRALGLGAETPPEVDYGFVARVAERVEQRRLIMRLSTAAVWAGVAALICWVLAPVVAQSGSAIAPAVQPVAVALLLVGAAWLTGQADLERLASQARRAVWPGRG